MELETGADWRLTSRQALTRLGVEIFLGGPGSTRLPADERALYMIVLDATLHGEAITAARISLISRMPRTSVTRRVTKLQKLGILTVAPDGWRVSDAYMRRPGLREWVVRMEALVRRTHQAILSDSDS